MEDFIGPVFYRIIALVFGFLARQHELDSRLALSIHLCFGADHGFTSVFAH
jgi:hypothetical protein